MNISERDWETIEELIRFHKWMGENPNRKPIDWAKLMNGGKRNEA